MPSPALPPPESALNPQTWVDLLTVHALKGDMFSGRTLLVIHEGIEKLAQARVEQTGLAVTSFHAGLFERLLRSFNNPNLLKEVGILYLEEFGMPEIAQKHFELARQLAPKDRDLEKLQLSAALSVARQMTEQSVLTGLDEGAPAKPAVDSVLRQTTKLAHIGDARTHLDATAGEMGRKQENWRKTGSIKAPETGNPSEFQPHLEQAREALEKSDFATAAAALQHARTTRAPKEELQAYYAQLGLTAFDQGRLVEALDAFEYLRDLDPTTVEGWFNCGLVCQKMGRFDDALAAYEKAVELAPENPKPWCNLSAVRFERGEHAMAEQAARRSIELRGDYARAWDNLASALGAMSRYSEAAAACEKAIRFQPALHSAWFKFGVVNFQLDNLVKAEEAFNITRDDPDFAGYVLYYHVMIVARRGELERAVEDFEAAVLTDPNNELESSALREIAAGFTKAGSHAIAADFYGQVAAKRPDDFAAWLALGTSRHRADRFDEARSAYFRAIEVRPESATPWHNLGMLSSDLGLKQEARDYFKREVELAPDDAKAWYDYGVSLEKLDLNDESAQAFEQAESLVKSLNRRSSDLSAALSIVRRLNLGERVLKME